MTHTLIINGVDFSDYIQDEVDVKEDPIYINGPNGGANILAGAIWDRQGIRYANSFALKPLPQPMFNALRNACKPNSVQVRLTTSRQEYPQTITAQITLSGYSYALTAFNQRIYTGAIVTIEAKDAE